jgi:hypothetical protein
MPANELIHHALELQACSLMHAVDTPGIRARRQADARI